MEEKNLNLKIIPPKENLPSFAMAVAGALILFLLVLTISQIVGIANQVKEGRYIGQGAQYKNTISIAGEGKIFAQPDIGQVDLTVLSDTSTVSAAVSATNQKMNKIIQAMKDLGIEQADLKTINYNISPQYQYSAGKSTIIGYQASQTLEVKIRDLNKISQILQQAADLGANQVGSLNFTFDDPEKLQSEARQKAIDNAKQKAGDLARSLSVSLGKLVSFSENSVSPTPTPYYAEQGIGGGGATTPNIQTGQNEILVNVTLTYEIY